MGAGAPPRSPTPSREALGSGIPVASHSSSTGSAIGRRHTIREGLAPHGSLSSLRSGASTRSALKRSSISGNVDDAELEKDATISELTQRVKSLEANAQAAAENFADQVRALQSRTEEAVDEATRMEEQLHSKDEEIEGLQAQIMDLERKNRDQENIYEAEVGFFFFDLYLFLLELPSCSGLIWLFAEACLESRERGTILQRRGAQYHHSATKRKHHRSPKRKKD